MDRQPHSKQKPEFFEPLKIFFAILLVSLVFFAPIVQPEKENTPTPIQEYPAFNPFASSADACPWACIKCTSWDTNAWPKTCLTYDCVDASGACGDPGGGGGGPVNQPPTISHVLNCSIPGNGSWCIGTLSIDLTASDPQGQSVIISGDVNGNPFTCTNNPCSITLSEGTGTINYKVDSATGLFATGFTTYQLDATTPQISGSINGSSGTNGWYTSQTSVTASALDTLSGLASLEVNADNAGNAGWASYSDTTFTDGMHTVQFRATDNAGNITETAMQSVNVDTVAPTLSVSTTGTTGANGWYVSSVTLTPTVSDATSGLYTLEATTDGVTWSPVNAPITLTDGIYTVQFRATDNAGNVSQTPSQQIKVDATTPSLNLNISGTRGQNDWYISSVTVTPNASDAGSGINKVEASINNGAWGTITSPLSFMDGVHSYKIRATDNAGNVSETPVLPMMVDTVPPAIATYDDALNLGDTFYYDLEDTMSGLWINRSVIEDDAEKYKKIVWLEELTGNKSNDNTIRWDGIFADGTKAAPGQYFITLKISDQAGNETMRTAIIEVTAFNSILPIPAFTPPASTVTEPIPSESSTANEQAFGGANNGTVGTETTTINGETVFASVNLQAGGTNSFSSGNQTTSSPISNPNVLWGATAAAMLGSTLAEWQKKREEEAARLAALRNSGGGGGDENDGPSKKKSPGRIAYEKKMQQKHIVGALQAERNEKAKEQEASRARLIAKNEDRAPIDMAKVNALVQAQSNREKLIAKNEDRAPIDMKKVEQLVQNNVNAAWQAERENEKSIFQNENSSKQSWWQMRVLAPLQAFFSPTNPFKPTPTTTKTPTTTLTPSLTPTQTVTKMPTVTFTPSSTATSTPTFTKTPLPTPTGTPSTETAESLLKYSSLGQQLYDSLKSEVKLRIKFSDNALNLSAGKIKLDYSRDGAGHMYRDEKQTTYLWGLIKYTEVTYRIVVDPRESPTYIAGTIAHEIYHHITPGDTQLEEYYSFLVGDVVRAQIVQAGYGTPSDLRYPLSVYNVNTNNPDLGQLIQDLAQWFKARKGDMPKYVLPKAQGGWEVQPLPTMPTETPTQTPTATQAPTQTPTPTQSPTGMPTETQTP